MRVLVAPQEFKGSLTAAEAAAAIEEGVRAALPDADVDLLPLSDGGPDFLDALEVALGGTHVPATVTGPVGQAVHASYLLAVDDVYIEAAQANGLAYLLPDRLDPLHATTFGVGELIAAALERGPARIVIGVGGSATTDGGAGMAQALGARLLDAQGEPIPRGGAGLLGLARIGWEQPPTMRDVTFIVATDVTNPLFGANGAAAVFGPQKGASPEDVETLERALATFARVVERDLGRAVADLPGSGAAGGLAAGLVAFLGASIVSGFDVVATATGLEDWAARADLIITGEGSFDEQSAHGKTTGRVIELAERYGKRCLVLAGRSTIDRPDVYTIAELEGDPGRAMAEAATLLQELTTRTVATAHSP